MLTMQIVLDRTTEVVVLTIILPVCLPRSHTIDGHKSMSPRAT